MKLLFFVDSKFFNLFFDVHSQLMKFKNFIDIFEIQVFIKLYCKKSEVTLKS